MKLYLVEIGGMRDGALFETHEVHALVASDEEQLLLECQTRFAGAMRASHLDGWIEVELESAPDEALRDGPFFFVAELGRNSARAIREEHDYRFLSAGGLKEAVQLVRQDAPVGISMRASISTRSPGRQDTGCVAICSGRCPSLVRKHGTSASRNPERHSSRRRSL